MPNPVLLCENGGARIFKVGRIGFDTGNPSTGWKDAQDTAQVGGFAYTGTIRTEDQSPLGEGGDVLFRRILVRVRRTGGWKLTMKVFVDGVQTQRYDNTVEPAVLVDQTIAFNSADFTEPPVGEAEVENILEAAVNVEGTFVSLEIKVTSTDQVGGYLLIESAEAHYFELAPARADVAVEAT